MATGGVDGVGRIWEYPSLVPLENFDTEQKTFGQVQSIDIMDDYLLVVREKAIALFDFGSNSKPIAIVSVEEASSSSTGLPSIFRFGCFGKGKLDEHVILGGGDQVRIYSIPSMELVRMTKVKTKAITCIDLSADGSIIAFGCADGSVGFLTSKLSIVSFIKDCHTFAVSSVCFGSEFLISGSVGGTLGLIPKRYYSKDWGFTLIMLLSILVVYLAYLWYHH